MPKTLQHTARTVRLNGQHATRRYSAEVFTTVRNQGTTEAIKLAMCFSLTYLGAKEGNLHYEMQVEKRFFLDKADFIVKKLSRAQKLALKIASLNDHLIFKTDIHFRSLGIYNTEEILKKWKKLKQETQAGFADMGDLANDFDRQLQDNIQQPFLSDNFYGFFFANIFYQEFEGKKPIIGHKNISNAIANLDIPIIEQKHIAEHDIMYSDITIKTEAKLAMENKSFPLAKLNVFLGNLTETGTQLDLNFNYKGSYKVLPPKGLITNGELTYGFEIGNVYKKTTHINFNLKQDER